MKLTSLVSIFFAAGVALAQADNGPLTAAVFDFQASGDKLAGKGSEAALLLGTQLSSNPNVALVERQELEKVLGEQELGLSGTVSPETAAKVGSLTGAKVLITGRVFGSGDKYYLAAKVIGTETSRVFGEVVSFGDPSALDKAAVELAPKISTILKEQTAALVPAVETSAARLTRLKQEVQGKKLGSVSVSVTERHLSHPVIDPAVETELKATLQQLGFEVLDLKSATRTPDWAITGEAFSELAAHRGNLVSCRARVEIKVVRPSDSKLVLTDRQTDVAVDLAENIAGKSALENAARKIVDRLVPKVVE